jgi:SAM-dependent methyltransferase
MTARDLMARVERRVVRSVYGRASERRQWLRETMYAHVDEFLRALPPSEYDALEISGHFYESFPWRHYEARHYPDFDICHVDAVDRTFGVVLCDQVIEHVEDPFGAARNLARLCAPGGYVVVGVPFLVRVHPAPNDYWRFTPDGLRLLLERAGLEVTDVRGWGNRHCANVNFLVWSGRPKWASLRNEPTLPVNVWAIARKPRSGPS